jgi:hypothetical protein
MSIAAEKLLLPRRDVRKKSYRTATATRPLIKKSCHDAMAYKLPAAAMVFEKIFQISLPRLYGPETLVLDDQIHSVAGCFTCKH